MSQEKSNINEVLGQKLCTLKNIAKLIKDYHRLVLNVLVK
jgi:hypothetical protein